jgi:arylformamidase
MITYRGLPAPLICDYLSREASRNLYAEGTEFHIGRIEMVANTGTYLDSPFHRYADGKDLSELPLTSLAGLEGVVVRCDAMAVTREAFEGLDLQNKAVLVQTGLGSALEHGCLFRAKSLSHRRGGALPQAKRR